ncbi:Histone H4 [Friedmanniomyces endolithicus]|nr:Histone H4 [Friedmanniomyces endolithicus]
MARPGNMLRSDVGGSRSQPSTGGKTTRPLTAKKGVGSVGGKEKGFGLGRGKTAKRHRKILRDNVRGITKGAIRRMARRGGVKRISGTIYDETRLVLKQFLQRVLKDTCAVVENCGRKTVTTPDVVFALHRMGRTLYGFGNPEKGGYDLKQNY